MTHAYKARLNLRPKNLDGISEDQVSQHWALYEGYVANVKKLDDRIEELSKAGDFGLDFAELKRRLGFEYNGMVLHEHYFGVLKAGQPPLAKNAALSAALQERFGGFDAWRKEFSAMGKMRGVGWVILACDPATDALTNIWVNQHEDGHIAGFAPVLVMDVWEHAYMVDLGSTGRGAYLDAFLKNVDWSRVERSFQNARRTASEAGAPA